MLSSVVECGVNSVTGSLALRSWVVCYQLLLLLCGVSRAVYCCVAAHSFKRRSLRFVAGRSSFMELRTCCTVDDRRGATLGILQAYQRDWLGGATSTLMGVRTVCDDDRR